VKVYLAGTTVCSPERNPTIQNLFVQGSKLHSFFHCSEEKGFEYKWYNTNMKNKIDIFLDSGAFSAFTQNVQIDIEEYIAFIKEHQSNLEVYANLDVIGSPKGTWMNQKTMERAGLNPLPCFHYGEDLKWLHRYLNTGYEYIALGGMVPISTRDLIKWLDTLFAEHLTDSNGFPIIKVHGFGLTSLTLMLRYPWYCMTEEDHTVLTKAGWMSLSDLSVGDEILAFNNGVTEWQKIQEIPIFEVDNVEINHLSNRNFEAMVSDNHRWLVSNINNRDKEYKWRTTDSLLAGDCINRVGEYDFPTSSPYTDAQIKSLAWFWTDGTIKRRRKYKNDSIVIYQSNKTNPEKCQMIREVLITAKEPFCESTSIGNMISFELYGDLAKWLLSYAPEKKLPIDLPFSITKKQAEDFIKHSVLADGSKTKLKRSDGFALTVTREVKKENLEIIRIICLLLGIPTSVFDNNYSPSRGLLSSSVKHIYINQIKKEIIKYTGRLWCVRVPSGAFFTKCKDKIYVTGNSVDSTSWVMTGRMGSIYVPKRTKGQWSYHEEAVKIAVSTRSPSKKDANQHISTLSPKRRQVILDYLDEKGYALGSSRFRKESEKYELKENERWDGKAVNGKRGVEEIVEPGISNDYKLRDEMNIIYFLDLEKSFPPYPRQFQVKKRVGLKGL
jgi:hypothetical protein